jgi:perosamine synthetase
MAAELDIADLIARLRSALPAATGSLALHEPVFRGKEWDYVKACIDTGWVSSAGAYVDRFEAVLADYTGAKHAIATVNGTAALHICLLLAGVERDDEVVIPALTFIATTNAVSYCGALPLLADSDARTLGIDAAKLEAFLTETAELRAGQCFNRKTGRHIAALLPMHSFGQPADLDQLSALGKRWHLPLIEDAAESLGSLYKGKHTGTLGLLGALSFNGNKIVTTGGGGAILTDDDALAARAKHLTTTARLPHRWSFMHDEVGYNYRLPNINAALGCAQLEQLPSFIAAKRALAERYAHALKGYHGAQLFRELDFAQSNYWLNILMLDEDHASQRDPLLEALNAAGLGARPVWTLMHRLPIYESAPRMDLSVAESLERRIINIPSSANLGGDA